MIIELKFKIRYFYIVFNIGFNKRTALHLAVEKENIEIIKLLLENKKLIINAKDEIIYHIKSSFHLFH